MFPLYQMGRKKYFTNRKKLPKIRWKKQRQQQFIVSIGLHSSTQPIRVESNSASITPFNDIKKKIKHSKLPIGWYQVHSDDNEKIVLCHLHKS
jgi:hypothetical protein